MFARLTWTGATAAVFLAVISIVFTGCTALVVTPQPQISHSAVHGAVERPPSDPEKVEVFMVGDEDELDVPEGVVFRNSTNFTTIFTLEDDFPTAEDPHAWVGQYSMSRSDQFDVEVVKKALQKRAAEDGATAVFIRSYGNNVRARGAYISEAQPEPIATRPAEEMLDELYQDLAEEHGFDEVFLTEERDLSDVAPLVVDVERGDCLWLIFALEEDAVFSSAAREGFRMDKQTSGASRPSILSAKIEPRGEGRSLTREARAGRSHLDCSPHDTEYSIRFLHGTLDNQSFNMGEGTMVLKVLRTTRSEEEIAEQQERREARAQEAREENEERNREICRECHDEIYKCGDTPANCRPYRQCVQRKYGDVDLCVEGAH